MGSSVECYNKGPHPLQVFEFSECINKFLTTFLTSFLLRAQVLCAYELIQPYNLVDEGIICLFSCSVTEAHPKYFFLSSFLSIGFVLAHGK